MAVKGARPELGRVTPNLIVRGGRKAVEFYIRAFGATLLYESALPNGNGIHANLKVGQSMIMVTDEPPPSPQGMIGVAAPESLGATSTILELYVDDVDGAYQRAVDAGAKPMMPVRNAFYGDRFGWVLDPFGHLWSLATVLEELTPDQINERMAVAFKEYEARS
jgi:PhnB protein